MNAFAELQLQFALDGLDNTIALLDGSLELAARAGLLRVRGQLVAMKQLLDLEEQCGAPDTERPKLTVVR